jgi:hypothetical protein
MPLRSSESSPSWTSPPHTSTSTTDSSSPGPSRTCPLEHSGSQDPIDRRVRPRTATTGTSPREGSTISVDLVTGSSRSTPTSSTSSPVKSDDHFPHRLILSLLRFVSRFSCSVPFLLPLHGSPFLLSSTLAYPSPTSGVYTTSSPPHGLSFLSLNANGLYDMMKTNAIKECIVSSRPHTWLVNETESSSPVASHFQCLRVLGFTVLYPLVQIGSYRCHPTRPPQPTCPCVRWPGWASYRS